jgi:uncharacterized protein (DUF169 family)
MGLKETMAEITAKGKDGLTYRDVSDTYIYHIRLDFDPVGIKFCANEDEVAKCKLNAKAKLTYCQQLAMARGGHLGMYMPSNMLLPYQAYHILNDYMAATNRSNLMFNHTPNSAVCSASVWALVNNTANLTTMCAGSKTSGKSDMAMMNLFIPGSQIKASAAQLLKRVDEMGGPSVLGKGGQPWPGLDVCKGCPLFKYDPIP